MKTVKHYSLKRDGALFLSPHFRVQEFRCRDGSDVIMIDDKLVAALEAIRIKFGRPVIINSAYRSVAHNKKVGGAPKSQHLFGTAADIVVSGIDPFEVCRVAEEILDKIGQPGGVGYYVGRFTHVDTRGKWAFWRQDRPGAATVAVSGFSKGVVS